MRGPRRGDWGSRDALPLEARPSVLPASRGRGAGSDAEPHPGRRAGRARRGLWPAAGSLSAPSPPCGCGAVPCSRARGRYHPPDSSKHALVRGWRVGGARRRTLGCSHFKHCGVLKWKHFAKKSVFLISIMRCGKPRLPSERQWAGEAWHWGQFCSSASCPPQLFSPACSDLGLGLGRSCCVALGGCY